MMRIGKFHIAVIVVLMIVSACVRRPDHVLSDSDMAPVVADMELAEAYIKANPRITPEEREAILQDIIESHGLTRQEFDSTMAWYGRNLDKYDNLCKLVDKELVRKKRKMIGSGGTEIESTDLWPYMRTAFISPISLSDGMEFSVENTDVTPGQRLQWKMRSLNSSEGSVLLGVEYEDGEKSYAISSVRDKKIEVTLQTDTAKTISRIFGNLLFNLPPGRPVWIDSIALKTLPFDSLEYYSIFSQRVYRDPRQRRSRAKQEKDSVGTTDAGVTPQPSLAPIAPIAPVSQTEMRPHNEIPKPAGKEAPKLRERKEQATRKLSK